jgi:8-oxo-dGTP pyrophosphatase MutT (NUDIX family)
MNATAISSGAVVLSPADGQLLIAMAHEPDKGPNAYVIPKGHVEPGESLQEAALREVEEETGLKGVQLVTYLGNIVRQSTEDDGSIVEKTIHLFLGFVDGIPALADGARWVEPTKAIAAIPFDEDRTFMAENLAPMIED